MIKNYLIEYIEELELHQSLQKNNDNLETGISMNVGYEVTVLTTVDFRSAEPLYFKTITAFKGKTRVKFSGKVRNENVDIRYMLVTPQEYNEYVKYIKYRLGATLETPGVGIHSKQEPTPKMNPIFNIRNNTIERTEILYNDKQYVLVLDNTYSVSTAKQVDITITLQPDEAELPNDLPIINLLQNKIPEQIYEDIIDSNDCFRAGHFRQSAIMLRKALETSLKIKVLQSGKNTNILEDNEGNQLPLEKKLKRMVSEKIISPRVVSSIEDVKWLGDSGAHTKMKMVDEDIKRIESRFRRFIADLELKI